MAEFLFRFEFRLGENVIYEVDEDGEETAHPTVESLVESFKDELKSTLFTEGKSGDKVYVNVTLEKAGAQEGN